MSNLKEGRYKPRIVPRWHTYGMAARLGLLQAASKPELLQEVTEARQGRAYRQKFDDWKNTHSMEHAASLVGSALVLDDFDNADAFGAAQFLVNLPLSGNRTARHIAVEYIKRTGKMETLKEPISPTGSVHTWHSRIASLKLDIRKNPRNSIKYVDIALCHSALGQNEKARHYIDRAVALASKNRFIARSAVRFFLHIGEPDEALHLLRDNPLLLTDPWLSSADIAISSSLNRPPRGVKQMIRMIENLKNHPFHVTELAGNIAMLESENGKHKAAKQLFQLASIDPTENSLAGIARHKDEFTLNVIEKARTIENSYEALCRIGLNDGDFEAALGAAREWMNYQPFSSEPPVFGSYLACTALEDFNSAIEITRVGLQSSPHEFLLLNNLAYSLASLNQLDEAQTIVSKINMSLLSDADKATFSATLGLLQFRSGETAAARKNYNYAVEQFKRLGDARSEALASTNLIREELKIGGQLSEILISRVVGIVKRLSLKELKKPLAEITALISQQSLK